MVFCFCFNKIYFTGSSQHSAGRSTLFLAIFLMLKYLPLSCTRSKIHSYDICLLRMQTTYSEWIDTAVGKRACHHAGTLNIQIPQFKKKTYSRFSKGGGQLAVNLSKVILIQDSILSGCKAFRCNKSVQINAVISSSDWVNVSGHSVSKSVRHPLMVRNKLLILKTNTLYWGGGGGRCVKKCSCVSVPVLRRLKMWCCPNFVLLMAVQQKVLWS